MGVVRSSNLIRTQSQGLWDQAYFQGTGEEQERFRNRNSSRPRQPRQVPSLKLGLPSLLPRLSSACHSGPLSQTQSGRNRIGNALKLGNLNNWTSGRPKDGLVMSFKLTPINRELWHMVGKLESSELHPWLQKGSKWQQI